MIGHARPRFDEEGIIRTIWTTLSNRKHAGSPRDPFNDDVSWIRTTGRSKKYLVAKCDMLVSSTDVPRRMSPAQIGMKAITSTVSDFAAKGVLPRFCLVSIALPKRSANPRFVQSLSRGLRQASQDYGLRILAGDTNASRSDIILDCAAFGYANKIVKRSGAKIGDIVGVSGEFGLQPAGLLILKGIEGAPTHSSRFLRKAVGSVLRPRARIDVGPRISKHLTASIDSSDGLAISLYHLAEASQVDIVLDKVPIAEGVAEFASRVGRNASDLALFGGEEYEIVCTYDKSKAPILRRHGIIAIGRVERKMMEGGAPRVTLDGAVVRRRGWTHF